MKAPTPYKNMMAYVFGNDEQAGMEDLHPAGHPHPHPHSDGEHKEGPAKMSLKDMLIRASSHSVFLVFLWICLVVIRGTLKGNTIKAHWIKVLPFAAMYFVVDLIVGTFWPLMVDTLLQAGLFHIASMMFSTLPTLV